MLSLALIGVLAVLTTADHHCPAEANPPKPGAFRERLALVRRDHEEGCVDKHELCSDCKEMCSVDKYSAWLMKYCPFTCGFCDHDHDGDGEQDHDHEDHEDHDHDGDGEQDHDHEDHEDHDHDGDGEQDHDHEDHEDHDHDGDGEQDHDHEDHEDHDHDGDGEHDHDHEDHEDHDEKEKPCVWATIENMKVAGKPLIANVTLDAAKMACHDDIRCTAVSCNPEGVCCVMRRSNKIRRRKGYTTYLRNPVALQQRFMKVLMFLFPNLYPAN